MSIRAFTPPLAPTAATVDIAQQALSELELPNVHIAVVNGTTGTNLDLGAQVNDVVRQALAAFAQNKAFSVLPLDDVLTPNQVAEILNVSRTFVMSRIEAGEISSHMVGAHHRVHMADLLAFKNRLDAEADVAMNELVAVEEEMGLD
jgi:excisionase family DNA binding protein